MPLSVAAKGGTSGLKIGVAPRVNRRNFCVRYILSRRWSFRRVAEIVLGYRWLKVGWLVVVVVVVVVLAAMVVPLHPRRTSF